MVNFSSPSCVINNPHRAWANWNTVIVWCKPYKICNRTFVRTQPGLFCPGIKQQLQVDILLLWTRSLSIIDDVNMSAIFPNLRVVDGHFAATTLFHLLEAERRAGTKWGRLSFCNDSTQQKYKVTKPSTHRESNWGIDTMLNIQLPNWTRPFLPTYGPEILAVSAPDEGNNSFLHLLVICTDRPNRMIN